MPLGTALGHSFRQALRRQNVGGGNYYFLTNVFCGRSLLHSSLETIARTLQSNFRGEPARAGFVFRGINNHYDYTSGGSVMSFDTRLKAPT